MSESTWKPDYLSSIGTWKPDNMLSVNIFTWRRISREYFVYSLGSERPIRRVGTSADISGFFITLPTYTQQKTKLNKWHEVEHGK